MIRQLQIVTAALFLHYALAASASTGVDRPPAFHVQTIGEGRAVFLVPGLASPGSVWDELAAHLAGRGYQARVLTLAGFAGQPALGGDAFLPVVRDALASELAAAAANGHKPVVIGHSLGGFLAYWLAATESESLAGAMAVDGLPYLGALGNPDATPESMAGPARQMADFMASLSAEQYAAQNRMAMAGMITAEDDIERMAEAGGRSDPAAVGQALYEIMTTDLRPLLPEVTIPVVLVQAADSGSDENARAAFAAQVAEIPDIRHVVADRGRHFVPLDDPDFLAAEVDRLLARIESEGDHE